MTDQLSVDDRAAVKAAFYSTGDLERDLEAVYLAGKAAGIAAARALVERQALDEALWFVAQTAPEAYLQAALRELHAAVEGEAK